ncbi:LysE family translocator [Parasulfitobacter algicola]|uniref:LysE family translocator n=1 Tax=Parasulfitobacter algicola TaxID=2614809 RepID=A0ABX2IUC2_9RHOB|nr:LysE family translocator [Sulfitobacter algicola]NSX56502.1 LysE family translocator [Sulfitobacter algicola]
MELQTFLIFAMTQAIVIASPGPSAIVVASQGATNGWRTTVFQMFGMMVATAIYFVMSATGLAALILASNLVFQIIKWVGVGYLIYLGLTALLSRSGGLSVAPTGKVKSQKSLFLQGFVVEFANPKVLLFFAAILPQFLDTAAPIAPQMTIMGLTGAAMQFVIYSAYASLGNKLANGGMRAWIVDLINRTAGAALIFAGIKMASVTAER